MATAKSSKTSKSTPKKDEDKVDNKLVQNAFVKIKTIWLEHSQKAYLEVANYLASEFFDNEEDLIKKGTPAVGKKLSFNALVEKLKEDSPQLPSRSWLYNSVSLLAAEGEIQNSGDDELVHAYGNLNVSHKIKLLTVKKVDKKKELILATDKEKLSVRMLDNEIKKVKGTRKSAIKTEEKDPYLKQLKAVKSTLFNRKNAVLRQIKIASDPSDFQSLKEELDSFMKKIVGMINDHKK